MIHENAGIISAVLFAGMVLSSCANTADTISVSDSADETTTIRTKTTTVLTTTILTTTKQTTTVTTAVTATASAETTAAATTEIPEISLLDKVSDLLDEPAELTSPFGDVSSAYICFGGTAIYPSVYVLSEDESRKLSKYMNSLEWEELPEEPEEKPTPGPSNLTLYIYNHGNYYQLELLGGTYRDETGFRYFFPHNPEGIPEPCSIYGIAQDLLYHGELDFSSTHLGDQYELFHESGFDINVYWHLIWDDVIPYIEGGRVKETS